MVFLYFFPRTKLNRNCSQAVGKVQSLLCGTQTQNMLTLLLLGWAPATLLRHFLFYLCLLLPCRIGLAAQFSRRELLPGWFEPWVIDTETTWWTLPTAFNLGTLTWVVCHMATDERALPNYHLGPVPIIEASTKDSLLVAAPLLNWGIVMYFFRSPQVGVWEDWWEE